VCDAIRIDRSGGRLPIAALLKLLAPTVVRHRGLHQHSLPSASAGTVAPGARATRSRPAPPHQEGPGPPPGCPVRPGPPAGEARDPAVGRHAGYPGPEQPALPADLEVARLKQLVADAATRRSSRSPAPTEGTCWPGFSPQAAEIWAPLVSTTLCAEAADENRGMRPSTSVG
jgi:hypothetical protein